jgi:phosphoribosylaminoimidazolecarboxamide formyltransferase/IMP cyclohydrolase
MIRRALLSVYVKSGLDELARGLNGLGVELLASGGTAARLAELGLPVTPVEEVTASPEILGGRVKTLHPRVHGGILARRDNADDMAQLAAERIEPIDLVCVNLYPFESVASRPGVPEADVIEMIDIGGPAMLRAAAKNFAHVAAVSSPAQYGRVLEELRAVGDLDLPMRRELAIEAFATTAAYEAAIHTWFSEWQRFPDAIVVSLTKEQDLAYGENPHQKAAYFSEPGARRHLLSRVEKLSGKELSYNNLNDLWAARSLLEEFSVPACVIVKHANPCGAALAGTIEDAYGRALASDPMSAFGGIVAVNRPVGPELAEHLAEQFVEVLFAPGYADDALAILRRKEALRILLNGERRRGIAGERDYRRVLGGMLVQDADVDVDERETMDVVTAEEPDEARWGDLLLAWRVAKHVTSNAIVIVKDLATIGVGAGQMSRVDSVRIAVEKAREHGHDLTGSALGSDAFFPFPDGPRIALEAGVSAIIQPGGSKRDADVIAAVDEFRGAMVFTHRRHFRH